MRSATPSQPNRNPFVTLSRPERCKLPFDGQLDEVGCQGRFGPRHLLFLGLLLCVAPCFAHPIDEDILRYEVQVFALTSGLRFDVHLLHGGLAAPAAWGAHDPDGDGALDDLAQQAWAEAIAQDVSVELEGRSCALRPAAWIFPSREAVLTCAQPIAIQVAVDAAAPRQRFVRCRVAVTPRIGKPVLARVLFVAPASVAVRAGPSRGGAAEATIRWPAETEPPDTTLPRVTSPSWFYELPENLDFEARVPPRPGDVNTVAPAPVDRVRRGTVGLWPAALLALLAAVAAGAAARRRQPH